MNSTVGGWRNKNGHKKGASWSDFESKVRSIKKNLKRVDLIKVLRTNSVFLVVLLLLGRKPEKIFETFQNSSLKRQSENCNIGKVKWSLAGNNILINDPILLEKAHEFAKAFNYNDFTALNYGCSNGCFSLAGTVLYIVKTHPMPIFFKIWPK